MAYKPTSLLLLHGVSPVTCPDCAKHHESSTIYLRTPGEFGMVHSTEHVVVYDHDMANIMAANLSGLYDIPVEIRYSPMHSRLPAPVTGDNDGHDAKEAGDAQ